MEETNTIDVFISYSSKNKNVADAVVSCFEQNGIRCWYAPRDIMPGKEWVSAIKDGIHSSKVFVLLFTDESNTSRQVMNEVAMAFNAEKTIVPFKLSEKEMNDELEYYLSRVHWLDAVSKPLKDHIDELRKFVELILNGSNPGASSNRKLPGEISSNNAPAPSSKTKPFVFVLGGIAIALAVVVILLIFKPFGSGEKDTKKEDSTTDEGTGIVAENDGDKGEENKTGDDAINGGMVDDSTKNDAINDDSNNSEELAEYHRLGNNYLTGENDTELDEEKALYYLELAYNGGNGETLTDSEYYFLAYKYDSEESIKNPETACKYSLAGAESGSVQCMLMLGDAYLYGNGVDQDYDQVLLWFGKALDSGIEGYKRNYCINCISSLVDDGHITKEAAAKWIEE